MCNENLFFLVWSEDWGGEIKPFESVEDSKVIYLSLTRPKKFNVDEWKNYYCVLNFEDEVFNLYVNKIPFYNAIDFDKVIFISASGVSAISFIKKFCREQEIKKIRIDDEASICIRGKHINLSDKFDVLTGGFSWYLKFFTHCEKSKIEMRKKMIEDLDVTTLREVIGDKWMINSEFLKITNNIFSSSETEFYQLLAKLVDWMNARIPIFKKDFSVIFD